MSDKEKEKTTCSFCGKERSEVDKLIVGNSAFICNECIESCDVILEKVRKKTKKFTLKAIPSPKEIKKLLDEYVIGQTRAKKILSTAAYNHYKRVIITSFASAVSTELQKSNVMVIGPTGCGKTLLAKTLAKVLKVPFIIADATALTEAGYVGGDVEDIVFSLLEEAEYDIELAQCGIIYIDEIDKIAKSAGSASTRDVGGEGVQQALLKLIEGTVAEVPSKNKKQNEETYKIDTSNILFICGGAFVGLDKIIEAQRGRSFVGFDVEEKEKTLEEMSTDITVSDLEHFGLIPELIGRIPVMSVLDELDESAFLQILTEPKDALVKQYQELFRADNVELVFLKNALKAIAKKAIKRKNGARGLRAIIESFLLETMYEVPDERYVKKVVVDRKVIEKGSPAICIFEKKPQD